MTRSASSPRLWLLFAIACLAPSAARSAEVTLQPSAPRAGCPDPAEVTAALARQGRPPAEGGRWVLSYDAWRIEEGSGTLRLRVSMHGPPDRAALDRVVEVDDCRSAVALVALLVERHLRTVAWTAGTTPGPGPVLAAPGARVTPSRPLVVEAGFGLAPGSARGPTAALDARLRLTGPLHTRLGLLVPVRPARTPVGAGEARARAVGIRAGAPFTATSGAVELSLAPEVVVTFDLARTTGITHPDRRLRPVLAVGAAVGAAWWWGRWRLGVELAAERALLGRELVVLRPSARERVLAIPAWQGIAAVRIGVAP
jgi:hypothetical protein